MFYAFKRALTIFSHFARRIFPRKDESHDKPEHYILRLRNHRLHSFELSPIPDEHKKVKTIEFFHINSYPGLKWLKGYLVEGYPDVIRVPFKLGTGPIEYVPARIESYENHCFRCTVLCQPVIDCKINLGETIDIYGCYYEGMHELVCRTIGERNGFEWVG